jgi:RimJ/RimL family protein N-acetyltransferase
MSVPQPAKHPQPVVLDGSYCRLEPLAPRHAADLFAAASPERYDYLFDAPPNNHAEEVDWITDATAGGDRVMSAVIDKATGRCEGRQSLMSIVPEHGVIELGNILWGERVARTRVATEALYLAARHIFDDLRYRRFEWKCNDLNEPSKQAAQRFGFQFEGVFRQHRIIKGRNRDTAWFAMLDGDWPRLQAGYERWLAPQNFDAAGMQKTKLSFG